MQGRYKAVIFDLDGTLVNSLEDIADSVNQMLTECGYPTHSYHAYRFMVGEGLGRLIEQCVPEEYRTPQNLERCLELARVPYAKNILNKSLLYEGITELLETLTGRGLKLAILSNKPHELTCKIAQGLMSRWRFEEVIGHSERFPRKPDTQSALYITEQMRVSPSEVIYVGDSGIDMHTANKAGFKSVGVSWGFRPRVELEKSGADIIIDHPMELISSVVE